MYSQFVAADVVVFPCVFACDDSTQCETEVPRCAPKIVIPASTVTVSVVPRVSVDDTSIATELRIVIWQPSSGPGLQRLSSDTLIAVMRR